MVFDIQTLLLQWEVVGVFDFVLPFLLIFAIVFGVLTATNIFGANRGVSLIIAIVIGMLALRVGYVQAFFTELFPRLGVAIAVLLTIIILAAAFIPREHMNGWLIGFGVAGAVFGLIAVINAFSEVGWFGSYWWDQYWGMIVGGVLLIIVIVAIFVTAGKPPEKRGSGITIPIHPFR